MQAHQDEERLVSEAEFRRRTNTGRTKTWELRRAGKLQFVKIGRRINYPMTELRRVLAEGIEGARHA